MASAIGGCTPAGGENAKTKAAVFQAILYALIAMVLPQPSTSHQDQESAGSGEITPWLATPERQLSGGGLTATKSSTEVRAAFCRRFGDTWNHSRIKYRDWTQELNRLVKEKLRAGKEELCSGQLQEALTRKGDRRADFLEEARLSFRLHEAVKWEAEQKRAEWFAMIAKMAKEKEEETTSWPEWRDLDKQTRKNACIPLRELKEQYDGKVALQIREFEDEWKKLTPDPSLLHCGVPIGSAEEHEWLLWYIRLREPQIEMRRACARWLPGDGEEIRNLIRKWAEEEKNVAHKRKSEAEKVLGKLISLVSERSIWGTHLTPPPHYAYGPQDAQDLAREIVDVLVELRQSKDAKALKERYRKENEAKKTERESLLHSCPADTEAKKRFKGAVLRLLQTGYFDP